MKIEEHSFSETLKSKDKTNKFLQTNLKRQSGNLQKENEKVIQLIHRKMYPLGHSHRTSMIFPKLKEKNGDNATQIGKKNKKYIEITLQQSQESKMLIKLRTDLEDQHFFKGQLSKKKLKSKLKTIANQLHQNKNQEIFITNTCLNSQLSQGSICQISQKNQKNSLFDQKRQSNASFFHNGGQRIINESLIHLNFLKKMKEDIKKQKEYYFKNVHLTELFENNSGLQKEKYSIQYLVKYIQNKTKNRQNISPFEKQSPNKLRQFANLFEKKKRSLMLREELELTDPVLQKEKSTGQQLRRTHKNRQKTIIEDTSAINLQNILSAKYRIKNNHKKLILLAKNKV